MQGRESEAVAVNGVRCIAKYELSIPTLWRIEDGCVIHKVSRINYSTGLRCSMEDWTATPPTVKWDTVSEVVHLVLFSVLNLTDHPRLVVVQRV